MCRFLKNQQEELISVPLDLNPESGLLDNREVLFLVICGISILFP
jgi:hypothetical protein